MGFERIFGGPISVDSKKHDDPGDSTPYNEYMALFHCSRRAVWVRNIIREINYFNESLLYYMIKHAMVLYADNDTATARARERKSMSCAVCISSINCARISPIAAILSAASDSAFDSSE